MSRSLFFIGGLIPREYPLTPLSSTKIALAVPLTGAEGIPINEYNNDGGSGSDGRQLLPQYDKGNHIEEGFCYKYAGEGVRWGVFHVPGLADALNYSGSDAGSGMFTHA